MPAASSVSGRSGRRSEQDSRQLTRSTERRRCPWRSRGKSVVTVEGDRRRRQQVERFERRRGLLEVHSNSGHIVLNGRIVARRVRVGVRPPHRRRGMPLQASIGPTRCQTRKRLVGSDVAPDGTPMRSGMCFPGRCSLGVGDEHQTRDEDSQRSCDLSDRGWVREHVVNGSSGRLTISHSRGRGATSESYNRTAFILTGDLFSKPSERGAVQPRDPTA